MLPPAPLEDLDAPAVVDAALLDDETADHRAASTNSGFTRPEAMRTAVSAVAAIVACAHAAKDQDPARMTGDGAWDVLGTALWSGVETGALERGQQLVSERPPTRCALIVPFLSTMNTVGIAVIW